VSGVPHRSLARSVRATALGGRESWRTIDDVPDSAADEFIDNDDLETSLWTDGENGERRNDVLLALAFARSSIGTFGLAMLWQDDAALGEDLGLRIIQSDGDTPYILARPLHYHVSNPETTDYKRLALASASRAILSLNREDIRQLIEDAFVAKAIPPEGLRPNLQQEIDDLIRRRFVTADELHATSGVPIFDIRDPAHATQRIPHSTFAREADFQKLLHDKKIGKRDAFVIYCDHGDESFKVARTLRQKLENMPRVLIGGLANWLQLGYETEAL
jgi:rhodanese-related sulfurtransferase